MMPGALVADRFYTPNIKVPFSAAVAFHVVLLMWDPTILKAGSSVIPAQIINVKVMDHMPVMVPAKPKPVPVPEPVVKKQVVKKAKKSGLAMHAKHHPPAPVARRHSVAKAVAKPAAPKPFISKITIPKFVPHESDEPIAASPLPGRAPAASKHAIAPMAPAIKLKGKSRGVRASDIHFRLEDRGGISVGGNAVVAIPIGAESGETVALPSAPRIHEAPSRKHALSGFGSTLGSGTGDLAGRDRSGSIGHHGIAIADSYVEGSLQGSEGSGRGRGKAVAGKGFEIGGPVGDRKIVRRRLPEYPSWAEEKGISALVKIYFTVKPDGTLRHNLRIVTSSGYAELDDLAKKALLQWRFSPTGDMSSAESAWGVITFRFTLA